MDSHALAMKTEERSRFCIPPPALTMGTKPLLGASLREHKTEESYSLMAQKMVDEQLSICQTFKSKIEESLQELNNQWNRRSNEHTKPSAPVPQAEVILPRSDADTLRAKAARRSGSVSEMSPSRSTREKLYSEPTANDEHVFPRSCPRDQPHATNGHPLDSTKTMIRKPRMYSDGTYSKWDSPSPPSLHCSSPPYRVPAKRLSPCTDDSSTGVAEKKTSPVRSFAAHVIKLEDVRDSHKSAFSSYSSGNHAPVSPSLFYEQAAPSPRTPTSVYQGFVPQKTETSIRINTEAETHDREVEASGADRQYGQQRFNNGIAQCARIDNNDAESRLLGLARVANEHHGVVVVGQKPHKRRVKGKGNDCLHLWEFLRDLLNKNDQQIHCIEWTCRERGEFRLIKTAVVAKLWGKSKNRHQMTYEKMARAMRYYYKMNILEKVPNKRLHFRFGIHMLPKVIC